MSEDAIDSKWNDAFEAHHAQDPSLYNEFYKYAWQLINAGRTRISHGTIIERLRWEIMVSGPDTDFKVNQNYAKPMALKFMRENPAHLGKLFEFRSRR